MDDILDAEALLKRVNGDLALLHQMVELFAEDYPRRLAELEGAVRRRDAVHIERSAHEIKALVSNFSSETAYELAFELEQYGRRGGPADPLALVSRLEIELPRLERALRSLPRQ